MPLHIKTSKFTSTLAEKGDLWDKSRRLSYTYTATSDFVKGINIMFEVVKKLTEPI